MKKENNKIENSFKERFDPGSIRNEGWNDPSDQVWEKIESNIYKEDPRKFGFLPFILMSCLVATLIFTVYLYQQNQELRNNLQKVITINEIDEKAAATPEVNSDDVEPIRQIEFQDASNIADIAEAKNEGKEKVKAPLAERNTTIHDSRDSERSNQPVSNLEVESINSNVAQAKSKEGRIEEAMQESGSNASSETNVSISPESAMNQNRAELDFPELNRNFELVKSEVFKALPQKQILVKENKSVRRSRITFAPIMATGILKTSGNQEAALTELIDKEYGNLGFGMDMFLTVPISRSIDFAVGLGVESMNFSTEYNIT